YGLRSHVYSRARQLGPDSPLIPFDSSGTLQALPSFPTRRSSDLVAANAPGLLQPGRARGRPTEDVEAASAGAGGGRGASGCRGADRKSTRLNSSHLGISYAVFCLKKKKTSMRRPDAEALTFASGG